MGPLVLQIQKIVNIAVPKDQSELSSPGTSRRILLISLTDGHSYHQAVEMQPIKGINIDTPPGTKIRLIGEVGIWKGYLLLYPVNMQVLGGNVTKLRSSWELNRQLDSRAAAMLCSQHQRQVNGPDGRGPPSFVPFGQKIINKYDSKSNSAFKAMDVVSKEKDTEKEEGDGEFSVQRQAAIAKLNRDRQQLNNDLAIPDISQLSLASKLKSPQSAPNRPPAAGKSSGSFSGQGRRGRGGLDVDDGPSHIGRPSQFKLFDIIQNQSGQDNLKIFAETAALTGPSLDDNASSSGSNAGVRRGFRGGNRGRGRGGRSSNHPRGGRFSHQHFREGSVASPRGLDSASPSSDQGGRSGTGRELPPRLKRHHQLNRCQEKDDQDQQLLGPSSYVPSSYCYHPALRGGSCSNGGWKVGSLCLSRWVDGGYYPVVVQSVNLDNQTCDVHYYQYDECQV